MLKLISGLLSMACRPPLYTHVAAPLPSEPKKKKHVDGSHFRATHSRLRHAFNKCMCRECCLVRATAAAPAVAEAAVARGQAKLRALDAAKNDIITGTEPTVVGCDGNPADPIDWPCLLSEETAPIAPYVEIDPDGTTHLAVDPDGTTHLAVDPDGTTHLAVNLGGTDGSRLPVASSRDR